jgi:hypothetical protein
MWLIGNKTGRRKAGPAGNAAGMTGIPHQPNATAIAYPPHIEDTGRRRESINPALHGAGWNALRILRKEADTLSATVVAPVPLCGWQTLLRHSDELRRPSPDTQTSCRAVLPGQFGRLPDSWLSSDVDGPGL